MSVTQSNIDELTELFNQIRENIEHQRVLRAKAIRLANTIMYEKGVKYMGKRNVFYCGPDVDNKQTILLFGSQANSPLDQMETHGKRFSLRRPRVNKGKANKELHSKYGI